MLCNAEATKNERGETYVNTESKPSGLLRVTARSVDGSEKNWRSWQLQNSNISTGGNFLANLETTTAQVFLQKRFVTKFQFGIVKA